MERGRPDQDDKGILDTVRRILGEEQARAPDRPAETRTGTTAADPDEDVLELEPSMMMDNPPSAAPRQGEDDRQLVSEQAQQTTRHALGSLRNAMREQKVLLTHRGGPSIEDVIREEMRPLLREWLDAHLPKLVEHLVRAEINRIVERDGI